MTTGRLGREPERLINKPGELPFVVPGQCVPCHEELAVRMDQMRSNQVVFSESVPLVVDALFSCLDAYRHLLINLFYAPETQGGRFL